MPSFVLNVPAMRRRFFVDRFDGRRAVLRGDAAHHAGRVLRVTPGQLYELSDGSAVWLARVESSTRGAVEFSLVDPIPIEPERLHTTLLLSIVKFDRFEWALEKATELGVSEITALAAARSEKALVAAATKRAHRWEKILLESAQQSRRLRAPQLHLLVRPVEAFAAFSNVSAIRLFFSESREAVSLRTILSGLTPSGRVVLAIGPEGGWTAEERNTALSAQFAEVSLGQNILRTETAVAAALAVINFGLAPT